MLVRIANREDPGQTASLETAEKQFDLGLQCLSMHFSSQLVLEILEHLT